MAARASIGIDLGTTNSMLAFVPLDRAASSEMLRIPQLESAVALIEAAALPSFLYLPDDAEADADVPPAERWIAGRFARTAAADAPGRVVHSAKSWLAHDRADRAAPFLPWGSDDVANDRKLAPTTASALILRYLREAWNDRFADAGEAFAFDAQMVTITVPASFDAVAQRLTLDAAREAGYPETVRLLEEPQAALYRWLEANASDSGLREGSDGAEPRHVLVVDIGGGTSDFSLFAFHPTAGGAEPRIERVAVSDHVLLGGDNMDLALAHRLEAQFAAGGDELSARQWAYLVARSRDLKEAALQTDGAGDEAFNVAIPGRGSRLFAQAQSAQLKRDDIEALLLDGFFPECAADEYPIRAKSALREPGLPYARDPAITRHLADFVRGHPPVDAVLFNGGALYPQRLRQRIREQLGRWQAGRLPTVLENDEPDLAVARGAARFGKLVHARAQRIEAGAAHAIFVHAHRRDSEVDGVARALVCVLPAGAPSEQTFSVDGRGLALRVNQPVRFEAYSSARDGRHRAGDLVDWNEREFHALAPLETVVNVAGAPAGATLAVRLSARISELGRLELACLSADPHVRGSWPLEFNLREAGASASVARPHAVASAAVAPGVSPETLDAARARIATLFGRAVDRRDKLTATRLLRSLEHVLGLPKSAWNIVLVRSLWATLVAHLADRERSNEHAEAWLILAGFLLRPGFGAPLDDTRIDRLWTVHETGQRHAARAVQIQEYVLWRRVAGGLSAERQQRVLAPNRASVLEERNVAPELVLLTGSFERIARDEKVAFIERFIDVAAARERASQHNAHLLAALGSLLNRAPLYGGPETVVPAPYVQRMFEVFERFDWGGPRLQEWQALFLRAARLVDNRSIDVPRSLRGRIADRLERAGVPAAKTMVLKDYVPLQRAERAGSFGESLPPGLILHDGPSSDSLPPSETSQPPLRE